MKFPRPTFALALLATMLAVHAGTPASTPTASPTAKSQGKAKKKRPAALDTSKSESVIIPDSTRSRPAMGGLIDSLRRASTQTTRRAIDSTRRLPLDSSSRVLAKHIEDSVRRVADSTRRHADSLRHVTDSVRRVDSTTAARRTWYVSIPMGSNISRSYASYLRERFLVELRRTGRVRALTGIDTGSWSEGIWPAARASGAGKILATTLGTDSTESIACMVRVYDLAQGTQLDSSRTDAPDTGTASARALARNLVSLLLPTPRDSACRVDSLRMASAVWAISVTPAEMRDTLSARALRDSLAASLRRSPWVSAKSNALPEICASSVCEDSSAKASGAALVLRTKLGRQVDSAWLLSARLVRLADGAVLDSLLVTGLTPLALVAKAASQLAIAPSSCQAKCSPPSARSVWTVRVVGDSAASKNASRLQTLVDAAFRDRTDRQFLSISASIPSASLDSVAQASGATRSAISTLSGSEALWTLSTTIRDLRAGRADTFVLRRGGPASRIFPWLARHLAAFGAGVEICHSPCRIDSVHRASTVWALVNDTDSTSIKVRSALTAAFPGRGKLDTLTNPDRCGTLVCIDSIAASRAIDKTVWPSVSRAKDSTWVLSARIAEMAPDIWTDSVTMRDSGAFASVLPRLANRFWERANPRAVCDSCLSTDTLEAALAILQPNIAGAPDSLRPMLRDSLGRILRRDGAYQVLDTAGLPGTLPDSAAMARLRCRTGAAFVLRSDFTLEKTGWRVNASLVEIATNRVVASLDYQDKNRRADRPLELAPWAARRLLGIETRTVAPSRSWNLPWTKIARLGIPAAIGITSVLLHL